MSTGMTNKEIENLIKSAKNKDWFKNITETFKYDHLDFEVKKEGYFEIYQYTKRQCREWDKIEFEIPSEFQASKKLFNELLDKMNVLITAGQDADDLWLNANWTGIKSRIENFRRPKIYPINHPQIIFLLETFKNGQGCFDGAFSYFFTHHRLNVESKDQFDGAMMAYEFDYADETKIPKRRNAERSSISQIRNDFERNFNDSEKRINNLIEALEGKSKSHSKKVLRLVSQKQEEYEKWIANCKKNEEEYTKYSLGRAKELETLYQEKLSLEAPASYWRNRSAKLHQEGMKWLYWLVGVAIIAIVTLVVVLYFITNTKLEDIFKNTGNAVRWSIAFITFVSFLAYGIRTFAKLMFSAFHLQRDAEEREQLTFVYLSLKNEQSVDDTERHLIMQALFSRADSGLLKEDSSPTMPGGSIVEKMMGRS